MKALLPLICLFVAGCSEWSLDTVWRSGKFRLIAIDTRSQMSLVHEDSPVALVGPTVYAVGADEKHIVLKVHPTSDPAASSFDRSVTYYYIVSRDRTVRGPLTDHLYTFWAENTPLPKFTTVFRDLE